jgi:hypothetical protein
MPAHQSRPPEQEEPARTPGFRAWFSRSLFGSGAAPRGPERGWWVLPSKGYVHSVDVPLTWVTLVRGLRGIGELGGAR